ncbi:hypothetical protein Cob_v008500 [Colletotrichum orbiculare MAFF 240422]|uniref:Uncharacterized protein n=1 Tax=Colletotrichum orbiculare (strain 104-T / ATCC 96160 / CBS 514.97 / LARS 414 / MAFF 240422) TaxID=1213857 RepID=A0A484FLH4_COLOR|nr:hypothetical protein Cob_v008500 [Colletotrichum orbiculare MAFF 240422]
MSFRSDVVEVGDDGADQLHGAADMSSHAHALARRDRFKITESWLRESFLRVSNRAERIAIGSPRPGVRLIGLGLLEHHITLLPSMQSVADALPIFGCPAATGSLKCLGWRQKVATWPLSKEEAMNHRTFAV